MQKEFCKFPFPNLKNIMMEWKDLSNEEKLKKLSELNEQYEIENNIPKDVTEEITHNEFVEGVKENKIGIKVLSGEPSKYIHGSKKLIFNTLVFCYSILPIILITYWSFSNEDWIYLIGIMCSYLGSFILQ